MDLLACCLLLNLYEAKGSQAHPHTLEHETPTSIHVESLNGLASALSCEFHGPVHAGEDAIAANPQRMEPLLSSLGLFPPDSPPSLERPGPKHIEPIRKRMSQGSD